MDEFANTSSSSPYAASKYSIDVRDDPSNDPGSTAKAEEKGTKPSSSSGNWPSSQPSAAVECRLPKKNQEDVEGVEVRRIEDAGLEARGIVITSAIKEMGRERGDSD